MKKVVYKTDIKEDTKKDPQIQLTEFNIIYSPKCSVYDTNYNAAYVAKMLCDLREISMSHSYWKFGNIFNDSAIYWTFRFFSELSENTIFKTEDLIISKAEKNEIKGVAFNLAEELEDEELEDEELNFYTLYDMEVEVECENGEYVLLTKLIDEDISDEYRLINEKNSLLTLNDKFITTSYPYVSTKNIIVEDGKMKMSFLLKKNAVMYFELKKAKEYAMYI